MPPRSRPARPGADAGVPGKGWGSVARRGARSLQRPVDDRRSPEEDRRRARPRPDRSGEDRWIDEGRVDEGRPGRMRRTSGATRSERARLPPDVADEVAMGGQAQAHRNAKRLQEAAKAYGEERYRDALRLVEPLARRLSGAAAVREVHGLCLYRLGRWKAAIAELSAAERLSGGMEHHPVIADCHRAMGQHREVDRLWEELREGTAPAAVVAEGRIVTASSLADRGDLRDAIELLEHGPVGVRRPRLHHLRLWYALAALYERAGDVARARQLFGQVRDHAPDFADVGHRYRALS